MSDLFPRADCVAIVPGHSINTVGQIQLATRPGRQLWLDASGRRDFHQIVIRTEQATQYLAQAGLSMERERLVETRERESRRRLNMVELMEPENQESSIYRSGMLMLMMMVYAATDYR